MERDVVLVGFEHQLESLLRDDACVFCVFEDGTLELKQVSPALLVAAGILVDDLTSLPDVDPGFDAALRELEDARAYQITPKSIELARVPVEDRPHGRPGFRQRLEVKRAARDEVLCLRAGRREHPHETVCVGLGCSLGLHALDGTANRVESVHEQSVERVEVRALWLVSRTTDDFAQDVVYCGVALEG